MSEVEKDEDILYLDSANDAFNKDYVFTPEGLVGLIMYHFKFGYGGYNGWFQDWSELKEQLQKIIKEQQDEAE